MIVRLTQLSSCLVAGIVILCISSSLHAQSASDVRIPVLVADAELPDAPMPQPIVPLPQAQEPKPDAETPAAQTPGTSSSSTQVDPNAAPQKTKEQLADEQLKAQKKQRVAGLLPSFNTSYNDQAVPLSGKQKIQLAFTSATDPFQFALAGVVGLVNQAQGDPYEYGGGLGGYGKRFGAAYADSFDGALIGNGILPALLHQDPRYFRRGYGSAKSRIFYAVSTSFICRHDGNNRREVNYSNLLGNLAAGGISNLYIPERERGVGSTFEGAALVTVEGGAGAILQEFWPDISRHFFHKDPTHGQDAVNRAAHEKK